MGSQSSPEYLKMSPMSLLLLLLLPLAVSSFPVTLVNQAESLKNILRFVYRNPAHAQVLRRVGARADRCIDAIDDAIDYDIDDVEDAIILSKVETFLTKYRTPLLNYSKNRFSRLSNLVNTNTVDSTMIFNLAQLCKDIGGRAAVVFRNEQAFSNSIVGNIDQSRRFLIPFLERKKFRTVNGQIFTVDDTDDYDIDHSDFEDSDFD